MAGTRFHGAGTADQPGNDAASVCTGRADTESADDHATAPRKSPEVTRRRGKQVSEQDRLNWLRDLWASQRISDAAKARGTALVLLADAYGFCHANQPEIEAAIGNRSTSRTSEYLWCVIDAGYLIVTRKRVGQHMSNGYTLARDGRALSGRSLSASKRRNFPVPEHPLPGTIDSFLGSDGLDARPIPAWAV